MHIYKYFMLLCDWNLFSLFKGLMSVLNLRITVYKKYLLGH